MADRIFLSNDTSLGYHSDKFVATYAISGNVTADQTAKVLLAVPPGFAGRISGVYLTHGTNGADGTDDLFMELDVLINGTTALSTKAKIDKAAGANKRSTVAAGTGITQAVIDAAADNVVAGDVVTVTLDITRTTPETEIADVVATVVFTITAE